MRYSFIIKSYKIRIKTQGKLGIWVGVIDRGNAQTMYSKATIAYNCKNKAIRDGKKFIKL
jgi:hypothetical protein